MMTIEEINKLIADSMFADIGFIDANGSPSIRRVFCTWHKGVGKHLISTNTSCTSPFIESFSMSLF